MSQNTQPKQTTIIDSTDPDQDPCDINNKLWAEQDDICTLNVKQLRFTLTHLSGDPTQALNDYIDNLQALIEETQDEQKWAEKKRTRLIENIHVVENTKKQKCK